MDTSHLALQGGNLGTAFGHTRGLSARALIRFAHGIDALRPVGPEIWPLWFLGILRPHKRHEGGRGSSFGLMTGHCGQADCRQPQLQSQADVFGQVCCCAIAVHNDAGAVAVHNEACFGRDLPSGCLFPRRLFLMQHGANGMPRCAALAILEQRNQPECSYGLVAI
jgi:hypothetical protein